MTPRFTTATGQHWAQINEFSFVAGMRLLFWLCRFFGRWPFRAVMYPVALWYVIARPVTRSASLDYLKRVAAFGATTRVTPNWFGVLHHFAAFAESILDKLLVWSGLFNPEQVRFFGKDLIAERVAAQRGGLLICCHLGNLELCRVLTKHMSGLKMTALIHTKHARKFNRLLEQIDSRSQLNLMQVTELTPGTAMLLAEKINQGEWIAIAGDRIP
ncbi:MAG: acyltransferase, partial [Deltaproteobacteria bacterium]|nr:acyltransferase [Deltaproteobacteria bacterium]